MFEPVSIPVTSVDQQGGKCTLPSDLPDGDYTFETAYKKPSTNDAARTVLFGYVDLNNKRTKTLFIYANLLEQYKTNDGVANAGHAIKQADGSFMWDLKSTYKIRITAKVIEFM